MKIIFLLHVVQENAAGHDGCGCISTSQHRIVVGKAFCVFSWQATLSSTCGWSLRKMYQNACF